MIGVPATQNAALHQVTTANERVRDARIELHLAIRDAHTAGATLRQIAQASCVSHEQVRRILTLLDRGIDP